MDLGRERGLLGEAVADAGHGVAAVDQRQGGRVVLAPPALRAAVHPDDRRQRSSRFVALLFTSQIRSHPQPSRQIDLPFRKILIRRRALPVWTVTLTALLVR